MTSKLKTLVIAAAVAAAASGGALAQTAPAYAPPKPAAPAAKPATGAVKPAIKAPANTAVNTVPRVSARCPSGMVLYLGDCFPAGGYGSSYNRNFGNSYGR